MHVLRLPGGTLISDASAPSFSVAAHADGDRTCVRALYGPR